MEKIDELTYLTKKKQNMGSCKVLVQKLQAFSPLYTVMLYFPPLQIVYFSMCSIIGSVAWSFCFRKMNPECS